MPVSRIKPQSFTPALLALLALFITPSGYTQDKAPWVGESLNGKKCAGKFIGFGPYNYLKRAQLSKELQVVETAHFTPEIEQLQAGKSSTAINDIGYTITAWPNHHRALHSAIRYRMMYWDWPEDSQVPPAECQLQRAIKFSPQDPVPYMMYGLLLHKAEQYDKALESYQEAIRLRPDDVLTQYNMGLTLVELEQYEEAVRMAKSAYAAGMPLPGLKNKLMAAGQWPEAKKPSSTPKATPDVTLKPADAKVEKAAANDSVD